MSLRLRLTLIYTSLLSGVVILLSTVMYAILYIVMINNVDSFLDHAADHVMDALWIYPNGEIGIDFKTLELFDLSEFQVRSIEGGLLLSSDSEHFLDQLWDPQIDEDNYLEYRNASIDGKSYRVLTLPLEAEGEHYGWMFVATSLSSIRETQRILGLVYFGSAIIAIILSSLISWFVVGRGLRPLDVMVDIAKSISGTEDLSQRLPVETGRVDEVGQLGLTFNQTLSRLERLFNTQRRFLADVSHELRTPLTVIKGNVGLMRLMHEFDKESLDSVEGEVDRLTRLVGDLLLMAQAETGRLPLLMAPVEIDDVLFEIFEQLKVLSDGKHEIRILDVEPAMVTGDRDRLKQVFLNLGGNAVKFTPEGKHVFLSLDVEGRWVKVVVRDEGRGIPKAEVGRLFDRFYRGDKARRRDDKDAGFGLGLPIAYWIV
ncbi:MAG TPA: HAMP domain-containing sensor histidine kinase [Brevefilum sp.]